MMLTHNANQMSLFFTMAQDMVRRQNQLTFERRDLHWNLPDAEYQVGVYTRGPGNFTVKETGYGVDLNGNRSFDQGSDGILAFDLDADGHLTLEEIQKSRQVLSSPQGLVIPGLPLSQSPPEIQELRARIDANGDGVLDAGELKRNHAKLWIDRNRDGHTSGFRTLNERDEVFDVDRFPDSSGGFRHIERVSPWLQATTTNSNSFSLPRIAYLLRMLLGGY